MDNGGLSSAGHLVTIYFPKTFLMPREAPHFEAAHVCEIDRMKCEKENKKVLLSHSHLSPAANATLPVSFAAQGFLLIRRRRLETFFASSVLTDQVSVPARPQPAQVGSSWTGLIGAGPTLPLAINVMPMHKAFTFCNIAYSIHRL